MYISCNNCKTQGLRQSYINAMNVNRKPSLKHLNQIDKNLSRTYTQTKFYGGSLKSFWKKIKKFGKHVFNSAVKTTKQILAPAKWIIHQVNTNDTIKGLVQKAADAVGSTYGVPGLGKMITTGISAADNIGDAVENIVKSIIDKKPSMAPEEIKKIITTTKDTIINMTPDDKKNEVKNKLNKVNVNTLLTKLGDKVGVKNLPEIVKNTTNKADALIDKIQKANPNLQLKEIQDLVSQIKNITEAVPPTDGGAGLRELYSKLPKLIKEVGYSKAKGAVSYLPYIDKSTLTQQDRTGKGGRVLKPHFKVLKPKIISQHKAEFDKLPPYKASDVAECAGRVFMAGSELTPQHLARHEGELKEAGAGAKNTSSILARLRARAEK